MATLAYLWTLLRNVTVLSFEAKSSASTGWDGVGSGTVAVSHPTSDVLVFTESGYWQPSGRRDIRFSNVFRWTLLTESLRLEHLRFGPEQPVFLFDLAQGADGVWREISPHACGEDCYSGSLSIQEREIVVHWTIKGPRKNESIRYRYR